MLCPRCDITLQEQDYEGETVLFCDACWGYWLNRTQLDNILRNVQYKFSAEEVDHALHTMAVQGDANRQGNEHEIIQCPECSDVLIKSQISTCPVVVDECEQHGIWLDTGEIKDLQIFLERGFQRHSPSAEMRQLGDQG